MKAINIIALILIIIGAINWGLWGLFQFDLVAWLFGNSAATGSKVVYTLVGLAGLWSLSFFRYCCGPCDKSPGANNSGSSCCK